MNFLFSLIDLGFAVEASIIVIVIHNGGNALLLQEGLQVIANNGFGNG